MKLLYVVMKADGSCSNLEVIKTFTNETEAINLVNSTREQLEADGEYDDCIVDYEVTYISDGNTSVSIVVYANDYEMTILRRYDDFYLAQAYADGCNEMINNLCDGSFAEVVEIKDPDGSSK